jgi:hypothetical protein
VEGERVKASNDLGENERRQLLAGGLLRLLKEQA